jgi:hypothetical protein
MTIDYNEIRLSIARLSSTGVTRISMLLPTAELDIPTVACYTVPRLL